MAIKVNGTTVIDDSRNLSNVGGLKTVNGNSLVGSGNISAGASTTWGAVGTYGLLGRDTSVVIEAGTTISGSLLVRRYSVYNFDYRDYTGGMSGTWRCMGYNAGQYAGTLFVRIS